MDEVKKMTIDEVIMRTADRKSLGRKGGTVAVESAASMADKDGMIKGRDEKGNPMKAKIAGKSLARRLMEEAAARKAEEKAKARKGRRRR